MLAEEITLGMRVRYPRTGTTGSVVRFEQVAGNQFAELDGPHLLYRIDLLIPAEQAKKSASSLKEDAKEIIRREREFAAGSELQEALKNIDQSLRRWGVIIRKQIILGKRGYEYFFPTENKRREP